MSSALARFAVACLGMALYAGVPGSAAPAAEAAISPWTPSPLSVAAADEEGGGGDEEPEPGTEGGEGSDDSE